MENKNRLIPSVKTEVRGKYMRNKKNIMFYVLYSVLPMSEIPQKSHRIPPRIKSDFQTRIFRKRDVHMIVYPGNRVVRLIATGQVKQYIHMIGLTRNGTVSVFRLELITLNIPVSRHIQTRDML